METGYLRAAGDKYMERGIFTFELDNLFRHWGVSKSWNSDSLIEKLLRHLARKGEEITILRIPTEKLDPELLKIRSQNKFFEYQFSDDFANIATFALDKQDYLKSKGVANSFTESFRLIFNEFENNPTIKKHMREGIPATQSTLYKQRKEAIEYIYQDYIPAENIEKIGEVNPEKLKLTGEYDILKPIKSIFRALLKGTPEAKHVERLNI